MSTWSLLRTNESRFVLTKSQIFVMSFSKPRSMSRSASSSTYILVCINASILVHTSIYTRGACVGGVDVAPDIVLPQNSDTQ